MQLPERHDDVRSRLPVATLGPEGTDAHAVAVTVSDDIVYCDSFREAIQVALRDARAALVPCGCGSLDPMQRDRWVDLHFEFSDRVEPIDVFVRKTKTMCAAVRRDTARPPTTVSAHPATRVFANEFFPEAEIIPVESKPEAVRACADGHVDGCIGSLDVVQAHENLQVLRSFEAEMVWVLYARKSRVANRAEGAQLVR